jgi:protein-disulfide isomerase
MSTADLATPRGHTSDGGVIVGRGDATRSMVLFEDPQCPYCRQFEELNGATISASVDAGALLVEYRMRCFLGQESVRADNALALAAEEGRFDDLRKALFAAQPAEGTGGFTTQDLIDLGGQIGLTNADFVLGIQQGRYENWVLKREAQYQREDPQGTPAAWLDGHPLDSGVLFAPPEFASRFRGA